jgi:hypothetical protein
MSYAISAALQAAVYSTLAGDAAVRAAVGDHVYDALPSGPLPGLYVSIGPEEVRSAEDISANGAWHDLTVAVMTDASGFRAAKQTAVAVNDALHGAALPLSRGQLVDLRFLKARAKRDTGGLRRIDLTFRARVEDS